MFSGHTQFMKIPGTQDSKAQGSDPCGSHELNYKANMITMY